MNTTLNGITASFKKSFLLVGALFFFVILVNIIGYLFLKRLDADVAKAKTINELVQQQEIALTQYISASSNSAIGLATKNWDLLLIERKVIESQLEQFEIINQKIKEIVNKNESAIDPSFIEKMKNNENEWLEIKRQNVVILRTKYSDIVNNEALPVFISFTKKFQKQFKEYQLFSLDFAKMRVERAARLTRLINYANFGFQIAVVPLLFFLIFIPGLERVKELEKLRSSQFSLSKMSALGEMAGGVAHEINNPLTTIKLLSAKMNTLLRKDTSRIDELIKMMATLETTSDRIAKIVRGLITFSRDGSADEFQIVNVRQLIEETTSLCKDRFIGQNIKFEIDDIPKELTFEGRATEISQVLLNLLNNAYDAILGLDSKWIRMSVVDKINWIEITVTDSGAGIPTALREKIFEPFFTTKEVGKGTGLGLSVSLGIIKTHMGELKVRPGVHTCFEIRLPKIHSDKSIFEPQDKDSLKMRSKFNILDFFRKFPRK